MQVSWYQKKHSPTHIYSDHRSSFICFLHLLWSMAFALFNLHAWFFLHDLSPRPLWSTSWSGTLHFILHPIIVFFLQHIATCFAAVLRLYHLILVSLSQLFTWNSIFCLNATHPSDHSHLCPLKCRLIYLSYGPGLTSMQHTTLHTTVVQSPSHYHSHIDWIRLLCMCVCMCVCV